MREIKIAFLGLGNVGCGVYNVLEKNARIIKHRDDVTFDIKKILVRDTRKERGVQPKSGVLTSSFDEILLDPEIEIVVEFMGGIEPASEYVERLLRAKKTVVTANKDMIANCWPQLEQAAKESGSGLYYEASVGGGMPIIRTLTHSMQANRLHKVMAIINGTTNHILTSMSEKGLSYQDALSDAKKLGLAEPDPTNDVKAYDAMYKMSILSSLAFHAKVPVEKIYREGIDRIMRQDVEQGHAFGFELKLLGIAKREEDTIDVRVHPVFIDKNHPLAAVRESYNAVFLEGDAIGPFMLYGRGAGANPTASAIISDLIIAAKTEAHHYTTFDNTDEVAKEITFEDNWVCKYYLRVQVKDKPGVLASIAQVLAKHDVSVESVLQRQVNEESVPVIFITHESREKSIQDAVDDINRLDDIIQVASIIRVER